jgi:WD40 repeat protein
VDCSPDGTRIVSASGDKTLKIWDAATGAELATLTGHTASVYAVAYSRDGTRIVSGSWDKTLKIWDAATGKRLTTLRGHKDGVYAVAYSPDGTRIVSASNDKSLRIWDAASGKRLATLKGHKDGVKAVACSPDGTRIVSASGTHWEHQFHPEDEALWVWEASNGKHVASLTGHRNVVRAVTYSPDGSRIASGSDDWTVRVWDAASGAELAAFLGHSDGVRAVAYSPDGTRIVSGSNDKTLKIWDAATFIAERCSDLPVTASCRAMKVTTSGFYEHQRRQLDPSTRARHDAALTGRIVEIHRQSRGTYGAPRVHAEL